MDAMEHPLHTGRLAEVGSQHSSDDRRDERNNSDFYPSAGDDEQEERVAVRRHEKLGIAAVAFFCFCSTGAGPFGIESSVSAAGQLPTLVILFFSPLMLITPIIFMMEEIGSIPGMASNHGTLLWVARALGPRVGFVNSIFQLLMNCVDLSVYPAQASDYLFQKIDPDVAYWPKYFARVAIILVFGMPAFFPIKQTAGVVSAVITFCICAPFIVGFFAGVGHVKTSTWSKTQVGTSDFNLVSLMSLTAWANAGFLANSNISGECKPKALLTGQFIALLLDTVMYVCPLIVVLQLQPDPNQWQDGYLVTLFDQVLPGLGYAVSIAGVCSAVGLYISSLTTYTRTMWAQASLTWLPHKLTELNRYNEPWINGVILICTTCALNLFDFEALVNLEYVFAAWIYVLFGVSYVVLRYTPDEPGKERLYRVPGGDFFATFIVPLPLMFLFSALIGSNFVDWRMDIALGVTVILASLLYSYLEKHRTDEQAEALSKLLAGENPDDARYVAPESEAMLTKTNLARNASQLSVLKETGNEIGS